MLRRAARAERLKFPSDEKNIGFSFSNDESILLSPAREVQVVRIVSHGGGEGRAEFRRRL
jgi:hypothetical protein